MSPQELGELRDLELTRVCRSVRRPGLDAPPGVVGYSYRMICSNGAIFEQLMIEPDGKIDSINFLKKLPE